MILINRHSHRDPGDLVQVVWAVTGERLHLDRLCIEGREAQEIWMIPATWVPSGLQLALGVLEIDDVRYGLGTLIRWSHIHRNNCFSVCIQLNFYSNHFNVFVETLCNCKTKHCMPLEHNASIFEFMNSALSFLILSCHNSIFLWAQYFYVRTWDDFYQTGRQDYIHAVDWRFGWIFEAAEVRADPVALKPKRIEPPSL